MKTGEPGGVRIGLGRYKLRPGLNRAGRSDLLFHTTRLRKSYQQ